MARWNGLGSESPLPSGYRLVFFLFFFLPLLLPSDVNFKLLLSQGQILS